MLLFWFIVIVQKLNVLHSILTDIDNAQAIYRHLYIFFVCLKTVGLTLMAIHIQTMHTHKKETRTLTESWIQVIWLKCGSFKNTSQNSNWIEYASFKWKISQIKYTQIIIIMMSSEMMALSQKWNVYSYLLELKCLNRCHQAIEKTDMLRVNWEIKSERSAHARIYIHSLSQSQKRCNKN